MASNTVATFFSKLLRPDKKEKSKQSYDTKRRRHSAPVPDWFDVSDVNATSQKQQKLQQSKKGQQKATEAPAQKSGNNVKKRNGTSAKKIKTNTKRNSTAFSHFFCLSGNVDTLERTPLPSQENVKSGSQGKNTYSQNKGKENDLPRSAEFMRGGDGKAKKNTKNRHSAPIPGWFALHKPKVPGDAENVDGDQNVQRERSLSPKVRYRVDGTLERPYVFPSGLTFGPEGRKTQLRRSTPKEERSQKNRHRKEQTVTADVHSSSREDIIVEYTYEDGTCARPNDQDGFDVRKAFYLKYDSNIERNLYRHSMPVAPDEFGIADGNSYQYGESHVESHSSDNANNYRISRSESGRESRSKESENKKQDKRGRARNRYSMPPKNDDCVYMGSFENLRISESSRKETSSSTGLPGNQRSSKRDSKRNRRNRYSMPVKNTDLVYMGSLENVNQLLVRDGKMQDNFSVTEEFPVDDRVRSVESTVHDLTWGDHTRQQNGLAVAEKNETSGYTASYDYATQMKRSSERRSARYESHRRSLPELSFQNQLSVARPTKSEGQTDSEYADEEDDFVEDNLPLRGSGKFTATSPFSRNTGRSSCMPGNKRFVPPPPCISPSEASSECRTSFSKNTKRSSGIPENRKFNIPPPPNYTPPKEEMERVQAHLLSHKGSQTDLSVEFEYLNMEDRDMSLKRTDAKTIFSTISSLSAAETELNDPGNPVALDRIDGMTDMHDSKQPASQSNIADISQGSDDVFRDLSLSETFHTDITKGAQDSNAREPEDELRGTDESPLVSFNSFLPQTQFTNVETSLKGSEATTPEKQSNESPTHKVCKDDIVAVTSTPRTGRRPRHTRHTNPGTHASVIERPIPSPRKRYSALGLTDAGASEKNTVEQKDSQSKSPVTRTPPVPKKRRNVSRSQSSSAVSQTNLQKVSGLTKDSSVQTEIVNSQEKQGFDKLYDNAKECEHKDSSYDDSNIYEEIDDHAVQSITFNSKDENIYEECGNQSNSFSRDTDAIPPLVEMKLTSSPRPRRRTVNRAVSSIEGLSLSQRSYYTGLSSSFVDLTDLSKDTNRLTKFQYDVDDGRREANEVSDDDSSVADDEMSGSNDDYLDDMSKRRSLRKCVSADDLLRSGSIVDRSMILARKRRHRMRSRKCKSQMLSSADTDDGGEFHHVHDHHDTQRHLRYAYQRKRSNSSDNTTRYKPKHSHNDSGHDSDMISPCTSPDAKRLLDDMTRRHGVDPVFDDVLDSCAPRQGTLTKKPWEIRLRNMQWTRRSRSRENLFASTSRLETISKTTIETLV